MAGLTLVPVDEDCPAIEIEGDRATVGRMEGVDHILNDPSVSRQHAVFERQGGVWILTDKGSSNGTFIDDLRISTAEVRDGQEVRFGSKAFQVSIDWADLPTAFMAERVAPAAPLAPPPAPRRPQIAGSPAPTVRSPEPLVPPVRSVVVREETVTDADGLWREKKLLVFVKVARLPDLCVKCGEPAAFRLTRKFSWANQFLMLFFGGLLAYFFFTKRAVVEIPLCETHRKRRTLLPGIGVGLLVLGPLLGVGGAVVPSANELLLMLSVVVMFVGIGLVIVGRRLVTAARIDDHFVWLRGVHKGVLTGLPPWPGPTAALVALASSGGLAGLEPDETRPTRMAQAALIAGCLSLFLYPAPVAVVLGVLGILDVRRAPGRVGMGRSVFGLVAGLLGSIVLGLALVTGALSDAGRTSAPAVSTVPASQPVVILGKNGALRITAPHGWRSETDINKTADLQACDAPQQVCVVVFEEDKKTTGDVALARFSRVARGQILKKLQNSSENTGVSLQIAGHPALQYELRGRSDRFDAVYLHTSVETPGHFYQVLGWTSSRLFPEEKAVISAITASFQPPTGR